MLIYLLIWFWLFIFPATMTAQDVVVQNKLFERKAHFHAENPFNCTNLIYDVQRLIVSYLPDYWQSDVDQDEAIATLGKINTVCANSITDSVIYLAVETDVIAWDLNLKRTKGRFKIQGKDPIKLLACSCNGKYLAISSNSRIEIWDVNTAKSILEFNHDHPLQAAKFLAFSPDNPQILNAVDNFGQYKQWDIVSGKSTLQIEPLYFAKIRGAVLRNNKLLCAGAFTAEPHIKDLNSGRTQEIFNIGGARYTTKKLLAHPDGELFFALLNDNRILVFHKPNTYAIREIPTVGGDHKPNKNGKFSLSSDGCYLASTDLHLDYDHGICLWDVNSGLKPSQLLTNRSQSKKIIFSSKSSYLISLDKEGKLTTWNKNLLVDTVRSAHKYGALKDSKELLTNFALRQKDQELIQAIRNPNINMRKIKELIEAGASINAVDDFLPNKLRTPLMIAIKKNKDVVIDLLLSFDYLELNAQMAYGHSALHIATGLGQTATVAKLLRKPNILVNTQDDMGYTALMIASLSLDLGKLPVLKLLLECHGIDLNIKNGNGNTALDIARLEKATSSKDDLARLEEAKEKKRLIKQAMRARQKKHQNEAACVIL